MPHTHTHTHVQALKLQQRLHDAPTEKQEMARASQQQQRPGGLRVWGGESQGEGLSGRNPPNSGQVASHGAQERAGVGRIGDDAGGRSGGARSDEDGGSGGSEGGTAERVDDDQVMHISV